MTAEGYELALSPAEVSKILKHCGTQALLVGGQALAIWAEYFAVEPTDELSAKVTFDVDFVGSRRVAESLRAALDWHLYLPSPGDATPQTAKVGITLPDGGVKQIDFLNSIVGLDTAKIQRRAAEIELSSGARIRLLAPLDVLESRLRNLAVLPSKRNPHGIAQAELAVRVARAYLEHLLSTAEPIRDLLDAVERLAQIALDPELSRVAYAYGLKLLEAVPVAQIDAAAFQEKRWPRILARAQALASKHAALADKHSALADGKLKRPIPGSKKT